MVTIQRKIKWLYGKRYREKLKKIRLNSLYDKIVLSTISFYAHGL